MLEIILQCIQLLRIRPFGFLLAALFAGGSFSSLGAVTRVITPSDNLYAAIASMQPGDRLELRGGTYPGIDSNSVKLPNGSSWADAPVISRYGFEIVTLGASNIAAPSGQGQSEIKYIIFNGLRFSSSGNDALSFWGLVHHIRIQNCEAFGARDNRIGINLQPNKAVNVAPRFIEILSTKIHNNGSGSGSGQVGHGIYGAATDSLFSQLEIYSNGDHGIQLYSEAITPARNTIQRCIFYGNGTGTSVEGGAITIRGTDNLVLNNIVRNNKGSGISAQGSNHKIYNNTVYSVGYLGINVTNASGVQVKNNIAYLTSGISGGTQSNNLTSDPKFVNPSSGDLHLQPNSPAIGAGVSVPEIQTDFDGRPRGNPPSIGAYEGAGGSGSTLPPPTNVQVTQQTQPPPTTTTTQQQQQPPPSAPSPTFQPSGPSTSQVAAPFLIAGVVLAALVLSD